MKRKDDYALTDMAEDMPADPLAGRTGQSAQHEDRFASPAGLKESGEKAETDENEAPAPG
jgi:hypothetical protein